MLTALCWARRSLAWSNLAKTGDSVRSCRKITCAGGLDETLFRRTCDRGQCYVNSWLAEDQMWTFVSLDEVSGTRAYLGALDADLKMQSHVHITMQSLSSLLPFSLLRGDATSMGVPSPLTAA